MATLEINLSGEDMDRLFVVKDLAGRHDLTAQQYAERLLVKELHRLFPPAPIYDETGELLNVKAYKG